MQLLCFVLFLNTFFFVSMGEVELNVFICLFLFFFGRV